MPLSINKILSIILFIFFLSIGTLIASRKPLWNDESYSQVNSISRCSYSQIIFSGIPGEGNKAPLFYLQQKIFCDIFHFKYQTTHGPVFERIFLRIPTVLEISLFFVMLFCFFAKRFNLWFGFLGIFVALSSLMLWWYWAEARPYGLWVLLSACQLFLLIEIIEATIVSRKHWFLLSLTHTFLALTCILSIIQITIISIIVLIKTRQWKNSFFLLFIPLILTFYYKPLGSFNNVIFTMTVDQLLRDNISRDRLYVLLFYPLLLLLYSFRTRFHLKINNEPLITKSIYFFVAVFSMIIFTTLFLTYLREHALNQGQYVISRHIIFLMPVGIIAVTYLTGMIWESFKNINWIRTWLTAVILLLLFYRIGRVAIGIKNFLLGLST